MDIEKLNELQAVENEGRGITCVKDIVSALERNDIEQAKHIYNWDGDKIVSYPLVQQWFYENFGCRMHFKKECEEPMCLSLKEHNEAKVEIEDF